MRMLAASLCALALPMTATAQQAGWSYAYVDGVATATQRDDRGRATVTLTCRPPTGDLIITDYTFGRAARNVRTAAVRIGNLTVNVPATVEGRGRNVRVVVNLPQRPPVLAGVQQVDALAVSVNHTTHTFPAGGMQMKDVAYACWGS